MLNNVHILQEHQILGINDRALNVMSLWSWIWSDRLMFDLSLCNRLHIYFNSLLRQL